jgi:hypothetical protein
VFMVVVGCESVGDYRGMGSQTYLPFCDEGVAATSGRNRSVSNTRLPLF